MLNEKLIALVLKLEQKSQAGQVPWEATADDQTFQATLATYIVRITRISGQGGPDYLIHLIDSLGRTIESADDGGMTRFASSIKIDFNGYEVLSKLFERARSKALGADKAIDNILSELG